MKKYRRKLKGYSDIISFITENKSELKKLYIDEDLTARIVASRVNVEYSNNFQKGLLRVIGPKGKGLGGSRQGSGNKKGIEFCGSCRKQKQNCICK